MGCITQSFYGSIVSDPYHMFLVDAECFPDRFLGVLDPPAPGVESTGTAVDTDGACTAGGAAAGIAMAGVVSSPPSLSVGVTTENRQATLTGDNVPVVALGSSAKGGAVARAATGVVAAADAGDGLESGVGWSAMMVLVRKK
jgi:hypothetical protein